MIRSRAEGSGSGVLRPDRYGSTRTSLGRRSISRTCANSSSGSTPPPSCSSHHCTSAPAVDDPARTARWMPLTVTTALMPARATSIGSGGTATTDMIASAVPSESATSPGRRTPAAYAPTAWSCPAMTTGVPIGSPNAGSLTRPAIPPVTTSGNCSGRSPTSLSSSASNPPGSAAPGGGSRYAIVRPARVWSVASRPVSSRPARSAAPAQRAIADHVSGRLVRNQAHVASGTLALGRTPVAATRAAQPSRCDRSSASTTARCPSQRSQSPIGTPDASRGTPVSAIEAMPTTSGAGAPSSTRRNRADTVIARSAGAGVGAEATARTRTAEELVSTRATLVFVVPRSIPTHVGTPHCGPSPGSEPSAGATVVCVARVIGLRAGRVRRVTRWPRLPTIGLCPLADRFVGAVIGPVIGRREPDQPVEQQPVVQEGAAQILGVGLLRPGPVIDAVRVPVVVDDIGVVDRDQSGLRRETVGRISARTHEPSHQAVGGDDRVGRLIHEAFLQVTPLRHEPRPRLRRQRLDLESGPLLLATPQLGFGPPAAFPSLYLPVVLRPEVTPQPRRPTL